MNQDKLAALEAHIDLLLASHERLQHKNQRLSQELNRRQLKETELTSECARLKEKNNEAKYRIEAMIQRLKSLEPQT